MTDTNNTLIAQSLGNIRGVGKLGFEGESTVPQAGGLLETLLTSVIGFLTIGAILWFIVQFVMGGYGFMTSGGDAKAAADSRQRIVNAVVGLVVVFAALVFASLIGYLLGVDILNIGTFINTLSIK